MKFSYSLIKKLVPSLKSPQQLADVLTTHLFEVEGIQGDTLDVKVLANRYSDAASHWGIARAVAAAMRRQAKIPRATSTTKPSASSSHFNILVRDPKLVPRYSGATFTLPKFLLSPKWLKEVLTACGIRSINAVVDIMNYVMLETGEPMHAFDLDRIVEHSVIVRRARKGEKIETLDGNHFELRESDLVIADKKGPLAIAGVKGGKRAEVNQNTKRILVEAATFDPVSVYQTARHLNLSTDASLRFSHGMSPVAVERAVLRAADLLREVCGAEAGDWVDVKNYRPSRVVLKFDTEKFNHLTGLSLSESECLRYLARLGFEVKGNFVTAPEDRTDISIFEDLAEEVVSLYGVNRILALPPHITLAPPAEDPAVHLNERIRKMLIGFGVSEVYNYSFSSVGDLELENPIARDKRYLRASLERGLVRNVEENLRFFPEVKIFEIGNVFTRGREATKLGIAFGSKKHPLVLELKGVLEGLTERLGIRELIIVPEAKSALRIESGDHRELGMVKLVRGDDLRAAVGEIDLHALLAIASPEREFVPPPKYPAVVRDLSIVVRRTVATGDLLEAIEEASPLLKDSVEVVDFFTHPSIGAENQSITFRLPFRSSERTLNDKEVEEEMKKIVEALRERFGARIR